MKKTHCPIQNTIKPLYSESIPIRESEMELHRIWESASVYSMATWRQEENGLLAFFRFVRVILQGHKIRKKPEKWSENESIHVHFFSIECESTIGFLTFWKSHISRKNLVPELLPKNLSTNQNARSFKLKNLTYKLSYEVG